MGRRQRQGVTEPRLPTGQGRRTAKGIAQNDVVVRSWADLQEAVFADSYVSDWDRYRSSFAFRGLGDVNYQLRNSLTRMGTQYQQLEPSLIRSFRKYAPQAIQEQDSIWHWLTIAQHHGLPTRLLDWTWSPFVAAHFATADLGQFDRDGVIWAVDVVAAREQLPKSLRDILKGVAYVFDVAMLSRKIKSLEDLEGLQKSDYVVFFEPPSLDARVVNQYALFSTMNRANADLDEWLVKRPALYRRIIIPAGLKWEVRDKLDQLNLTERVLFPGLDGLSAWLRRNYFVRQKIGKSRPKIGAAGGAILRSAKIASKPSSRRTPPKPRRRRISDPIAMVIARRAGSTVRPHDL